MTSLEELNNQICDLLTAMENIELSIDVLERQIKELKRETEKLSNDMTEYQIINDI